MIVQDELKPNQENVADSSNEDSVAEIMDPGKLDGSSKQTLTKWKNEPQIVDLKADLEFARQENTDQKANVAGWLALRDTTGVESGQKSKEAGRSSVQPKMVRKHNEWRYPALSEPFLNTERMFNINPRTGEDKAGAKQNQILLNWQFDTKLNKVDWIDRYVRKTVDEGTVIVRVGWEKRTEKVQVEEPVYDYFPIDDPEQLAVLDQAIAMFEQDEEAFANEDSIPDTLRASVEYSIENSTPVYAEETGTKMVLEERVTWNAPSLKIVNIGNFFIDPSCEGDWENAQFMIHTYEATKSALKKRKVYKNLDEVNWEANTVKSKLGDPDHVSTGPQVDSRVNTDKSKVLVYEYWGLYDIHDDGVMVPVSVTFIGETIIEMVENPFPDRKPPFVVVPYMPIADSVFGEADASLLQDNQRVQGAVTRGMIDLLGRSANAQSGYAKGFLDPINKRRFTSGHDFEFNPNADPKVAIQQMKYPEIPNSALQMSAQQNAEAEGLSGVKAFAGGITGDAYGQVARGISGALDAAGQREMSILRRLAEGMMNIGKKIIAMNAVWLEESEIVRVTNEDFVEVRRDELAGNYDLIVDISTQSVDEQKAQDLGMMLQTQGPNMDPALEQIILAEIAELKRMPHLAKQIREYAPEPDPMAVEMHQLEMRRITADIELVEAKTMKEMAQAENVTLDTELDQTGARHDRNVETMGAQARGNRDLEVSKALLAGETGSGNIEAAVGFNRLTEDSDTRQGNGPPPAPQPPQAPMAPMMQQPPQPQMAPLQSAPQPM
jgi:hypothetical protein